MRPWIRRRLADAVAPDEAERLARFEPQLEPTRTTGSRRAARRARRSSAGRHADSSARWRRAIRKLSACALVPGRRRARAGRPSISSKLPRRHTRPLCMNETRSAMRATKSRSCSTTRKVTVRDRLELLGERGRARCAACRRSARRARSRTAAAAGPSAARATAASHGSAARPARRRPRRAAARRAEVGVAARQARAARGRQPREDARDLELAPEPAACARATGVPRSGRPSNVDAARARGDVAR